MEGAGNIIWKAKNEPLDFGFHLDGTAKFTNGREFDVSAMQFKPSQKQKADEIFRCVTQLEHQNVANVYWQESENNGETLVVDRLGMDFYHWVYQPNLALWERDAKGKIVGTGKDFIEVFRGILRGLEHYVDKVGYHGNLINGVTVYPNKKVKLFWPAERQLDLVHGFHQDFVDLSELVKLAVAAGVGVPFGEEHTYRIECVWFFLEIVKIVLPCCTTMDQLKNFWVLTKINPIFQDPIGRYETVRKFYLLLDKTVAFQQVKLDRYPTNMKGWYWKLGECNSFLKDMGSDKRKIECDIRKVKYPADYKYAISVFDFHRQSFDHANEEKRPKSSKKKRRDQRPIYKKILKSTTEISKELFRVYPDFLPKFFYEFIMNIYDKTIGLEKSDIDASVSELVGDLMEGPYMGIVS